MSKIEVDKLDPQSGTALEIGTSGDTVTVPSGVGLTLTDSTLLLPTTITSTTEVKTNKISPATGTAFALGDSGDTFTVPSGATIVNSGTSTGFGDSLRPNAQPFLINGGMEVNQRTGTTATSFVNNTYGVDRWINYLNGSCVLNYQQLTRSSSIVTDLQTDSGKNFDNVLMLDCTSSASLGATDLVSVLQLIEGYVHNPMAGKAITLSFWVRSNLTGTYCVAFKQGSAKTYVVEYTISSADTWEQKIITLTDDTLANYSSNTSTTNGSSLQVNFSLRLGTTAQQTTADAWNAGNFYGTSNQVTWGTSTLDFFYLSGVQLEMGTYTSATLPPFQFESFENNVSRCQRYYQKSYAIDTVPGNTDTNNNVSQVQMANTSSSTANNGVRTRYLQRLRANPTATLYAPDGTSGNLNYSRYGAAQAEVSGTITSAGTTAVKVYTTNASGMTAGDAVEVFYHYTVDAEL